MTASWTAGGVRARAMLRRRAGRDVARAIGCRPSLPLALGDLVVTAYGREVTAEQSLAEAERAVESALLWDLRVLAGWIPDPAPLRALAAGYEIANVDQLLGSLAGSPALPEFRLGSLATAWRQLRTADSVASLRERLRTSTWGDPGTDDPAGIQTFMRLAWAERVTYAAPPAAGWARAAAAMYLIRERWFAGRELTAPSRMLVGRLLGPRGPHAESIEELRSSVPRPLRELLPESADPLPIWQAQAAWWRRVETDAAATLHERSVGSTAVVAVAALLAADMRLARAALELAARGGVPVEVFDAAT